MRSAKILLKMENKVRAQLPKWFEGTVIVNKKDIIAVKQLPKE